MGDSARERLASRASAGGSGESGTSDPEAAGRSPSLLALAALLVLEALAVLGYAGFLGVELGVEQPASWASTVALIALLAVTGVLLLAVARACWQRRPWIRGAAITWQVLQMAAAWVLLEGDLAPALGWALLLSGLIGTLLAILPSTRRSLAPRG